MTASACPARSAIPCPASRCASPTPRPARSSRRDEIGMIEVKGPNVFKGYWRMPEKTKAEFRDDGFFITGDLGKIDDKGYVHILGRGKDLVISGGFNVYPKEIESEIDAMPGVVESAVIGVPHADFGEGVTAVVVCNKGAEVDRSRRAEGARRHGSPNSRCRSGCSSSTNCRATPWARCRRIFCAIRIRIFIRNRSAVAVPSRVMNREQAEILDMLEARSNSTKQGSRQRFCGSGQDAAALRRSSSSSIPSCCSDLCSISRPDPFEEFPEISSSLRWDQVNFRHLSEAQVDQIILSVKRRNGTRWPASSGTRSNEAKSSLRSGRSVRGSHSGLGRSRRLARRCKWRQRSGEASDITGRSSGLTADCLLPAHQADHKPPPTMKRYAPNAISSVRFDIACAALTPSGAVIRLVGITSSAPISET